MDIGITPAEFYADPERRIRAVVLRRAGEMGRAALALSGLLGTLRRRAVDAGETPTEPMRGHHVLVLTTRALAWATALRKCLMRDNREDKATLLRPDPAAARPDRAAERLADAAADAAPVEVPVGDAVEAPVVDAVEAPAGDAAAAPVAAAQPAVPGEEPCFVFLTAAQLDAGLLAAERRAAKGPRAIDPKARERGRRAVRDRRRCSEDEAAMVVVSGLTMAQTMGRISEDLIAAARSMGDTATIGAVQGAMDDLIARSIAYTEALEARRHAEAAEAVAELLRQAAVRIALDERDLDEPDLDEPDLDEPDLDELASDESDLDESDSDESDLDESDLDELEADEPEPVFVAAPRYTHRDELLYRQAMRAAFAARNKTPDTG